MEEKSLCPVRALSIYLDMSKSLPWRATHPCLCPHVMCFGEFLDVIFFFLREEIMEVCDLRGVEGPLLRHVVYDLFLPLLFP